VQSKSERAWFWKLLEVRRNFGARYDSTSKSHKKDQLTMRFILLLILLLLVIGALPTWPYSVGWGYYPSGLGVILLIVLLIVLLR
jgi:hypothetical protein